jgi:hypothetical protein
MGIRRAAIQTTADRTVSYQSGQSTNGTISSGGGTLVTSIVYTDNNYNTLTANAASTTFGTFRILGTNLEPGANVMLANTAAGTFSNVTSNTTYVGSNEIRANVSVTAGNYSLYIFNPDGSAAIYYSGVLFEPYPQWTTTSYTSAGVVNVQLLTSSTAVEQPITYALVSGTLPTGTSLSANGLISGTVTQANAVQAYTFTVSATDIYNETTQSSITLTIALADQYFNQTTLLLNGETNTNTYIQDISNNNFALTVNGSATPNRFNPLWGNGYYGNYFDGGSYLSGTLTTPTSATAFTIEAWVYLTSYPGSPGGGIMGTSYTASTPYGWFLNVRNTGYVSFNETWGASGFTSTNVVPLNQWVHIAATRNGATATIYINGVPNGTGTFNQTYTSTQFVIGRDYVGSSIEYFGGYISNLRYVNNVVVYTSAFTPPTTPLTAIANTTLLTCQSANFVDNSTNAFTLTPTGTVKVVPNQPFGALPSSVQNYGSSLFDGSTGYLSSNVTPLGNGDWTVEFWMYPLSTSNQYIFSLGATPDWGDTLGCSMLYYSNPTTPYFSYSVGSQYSITVASPIINQWVHIALVQKSTITKLYINGVAQATTFTNTTNLTGTKVQIGHGGASSWSPFYGSISNFRVVSGTAVYTSNFIPPTTPLTAIANTSLLTLQNKNGANNNTFYDDSVNNFPITRTGTPTQGTFTPFSQTGWSNYFGGSSYIAINYTTNSTIAGDFTWETWAYDTGSSYGSLLGWRNSSVSWSGFIIQRSNSNNVTLAINNGTSINQSSNTYLYNQWNHVAVVRSGTTVTLYVNGISQGNTTVSGSFNPGTAYWIGSDPYNNVAAVQMIGYISNQRLINGTALYTSNFTPSTTPLTAIANTALLTCQSNRFIDNSTNAYAITPSGTVQVQAFSPFAPGVSYSSANNGGSMYFNGSTDYLNAVGTSTVIGTGDFTIEFWAYINAAVSSAAVFVDMRASSSAVAPLIQMYTSNILYYSVGSSNVITGPALAFNQWYHIAVSRASGSTKMFVNGVQVGSTYTDSNTYVAQTNRPILGSYGDTVANRFNGYLSNLRILNQSLYTTTFTPPNAPPTPTASTSLLLLGTNTGVQDATGKNDIITVGSAKTQANTVKYGTGAIYFDGSSYCAIPDNPGFAFGTGNFTIEFWFNLTSLSGGVLIAKRANSTVYAPWNIGINSGTVNLNSSSTGSSWDITITNGGTVSANTWYHVAVVRNGTTFATYLNGVQQGTTTSSASLYVNTSTVNIGGDTDTFKINGYIDDLRITKGVARYTANFTPPTITDFTL